MASDTSRTLQIESSPTKLLGLVGIGVLMTAVSLFVALLPDEMAPHNWLGREEALIVGWCGVLFFGLCTVVAVWRLLTVRGPVITISPQGIRDTRVAAQFIPWTAIRNISTFEVYKQKSMMLAVDQSAQAQLGLTPVARWGSPFNQILGADGLAVTAAGLKIDYPKLLEISTDYWNAARTSRQQHP